MREIEEFKMPIFSVNFTISKNGCFFIDAKNKEEAIKYVLKCGEDYADNQAYDGRILNVTSCEENDGKDGVSFGCLKGNFVELYRDDCDEKFAKSLGGMTYKEYKKLKYGRKEE